MDKDSKEYLLDHPEEWTEYNGLIWAEFFHSHQELVLERLDIINHRVSAELDLNPNDATYICEYRALPGYSYEFECSVVTLFRKGYTDIAKGLLRLKYPGYFLG